MLNLENSSYKKLYENISSELMLYKTSFEFSQVGKIILDKNFKVITINKAALTYLNINTEQAYTIKIFSFLKNVPPNLGMILENSESYKFSSAGVLSNYYLEINITKVNVFKTYYIIHLNDITELLNTQRILINKNKFIDNLLATSPNIIYVHDLRSNSNIFMNESGLDILGYSQEDLKNMKDKLFNNIVHPEDIPKINKQNSILKNSSSNDVYEIELRLKIKNGTYRWFLARERVFRRDEDGVPIEKIGIITDITKRKQSEELIKLHSAAILDAKNGMLITDKDGTIIWANNAFCEMLGYTMDEIIGENPRIFKSGLHSKEYYESMWKTILSGEVWFDSITNKTKSGGIINTKLIITPIKDEQGNITHFIGIKQFS